MAAAARPVPRTAVPVLVIRPGEEGSLLMISEARSDGGGGFEEVAIERLEEEKVIYVRTDYFSCR